MDTNELARKVYELNEACIHQLDFCDRLYNLYNEYLPAALIESAKYKSTEIPLLIKFLHHILFSDIILNLNSLFMRVKENDNNKELSLYELSNLLNDKDKTLIEAEINDIHKIWDNKDLKKWRNKGVAHKDLSYVQEPLLLRINFINKDIVRLIGGVLKRIKELLSKHFEVTFPITNIYQKGFDRLILLLESELKG